MSELRKRRRSRKGGHIMNMIPEKTKELRMTASELKHIRQNWVVCSHCGTPFVREDPSFMVCEICVRDAMEDEGFEYKETSRIQI